jgi:ElaB/YqjD/DUF883 family membrane-anchored ribosome-binding protein
MGATPNFGTNDTPGMGAGAGASGSTGSNSFADDVSFNRGGTSTPSNTGTEGTTGSRNVMESGMEKAQDTMSQLQQKASELTSRLIDNVNVEDITNKLEAQVREHPARTLLVAVGAGFLLGRTLKHK